MLNNQIIITDANICARAPRSDAGVVDAAKLTNPEWGDLLKRNVNSPKSRLVQCAKCWQLYSEVQWLQTFNRLGGRVIRHQPGEARPDHEYESVETPEHRAWNNRVVLITEPEGFNPRKEAWSPDRTTRADVLLTGTVTIAYEHQHSPFSSTGRYSAPERARLAAAAGRTPMWHTTSDKVRGLVPILRTDSGFPPKIIENPNYRHEFRGGIYRIEIYTCTVRDGHECPDRKFSGCGKPHARGQVTAGQLDDVLRGAPVGKFMPMYDVEVIRAPRFFWTDAESYVQYLAYIGALDPMPILGGTPVAQAKTKRGARSGHSRAKEAELEAMRAQAVILRPAPAPAPARTAAPTRQPSTSGTCSHWIGTESRYCRASEGVRRYIPGFRCPAHTPNALHGKPEVPPGPGWPKFRGVW